MIPRNGTRRASLDGAHSAMSNTHESLSETHIVGADTQEWKVRAEECPSLALHHIAHAGVANAAAPYEMTRMDLSGTYLLSCFGGRGRILLDGRWQGCRESWARPPPPPAPLAF